MNYSLNLDCKTSSPGKVMKVMQQDAGKKDRSEVRILAGKDKITFKITSKDSIALKASINSVIKGLTIYEKTLEMVKNE